MLEELKSFVMCRLHGKKQYNNISKGTVKAVKTSCLKVVQ